MSLLSRPPEIEHRRRSWSRPITLVLIAAISLVASSGLVSQSAGDERVGAISAVTQPPTPQSATPPTPPPAQPDVRPIEDDEKAYWSEVAIFRAGPNRPRSILVVRRAKQPPVVNPDDGVGREILIREIVRQGFILAARQGFDVVVRDLAIGDPDEPGRADLTYRLGSLFQPRKQETDKSPLGGRVMIVEGSGGDRKVVWHHDFDCIEGDRTDQAQLISQVEILTRTDFRDVLAGWKLPPSPAHKSSKKMGVLPPGVEKRLLSLAETDQFAALRALHEAVRRDGGSIERWQALSRGYAMLGSLTEPLMSVLHEVFKARSLLYAQKAVVVENDSPRSLRERAFAEAMVGLFKEARADLDQADDSDNGKGVSPRISMIRAYLATDPDALGKLAAESPDDLTPLYLQAIVRSRLSGPSGKNNQVCRNEVIANLDAVLAKVPDCHRIIDAMCEASGVANLHRATTIDLESFASTSAARVSAVPGLPPALARQLKGGVAVDELTLREAIVKASSGDTNDLSWGVLAEQLREIRFLQVCRRLHFLTYMLAAGASEFVEEARPMVADHPNHEYIELFPGRLDRDQTNKILDRLDFAEMELKNLSVMRPVRLFDNKRWTQLFRRSSTQDGWNTVPICERHTRWYDSDEARTRWANFLLYLDQESPVARVILVESDWSTAAPQVADWEREQPWNTAIIAAHGWQLLKEKRFAEAQERFETALARSADVWIFNGLAQSYRERGRIDLWVKAAEAIMEQPDQALDHATISNTLARFLMEHGQVDLAWPWAERAAESWAGWAMRTASECAEMRRDWENAELWAARSSERYEVQRLDWLSWCERTGRGDLKAASELVWAQWDATKSAGTGDEAVLLPFLGLIFGRADVTRQIAETRLEANRKSLNDWVLLATACDLLGDLKGRDKALDSIVTEPDLTSPETAKILAILIEWYRHQETTKLDLARIDAMLAEDVPQHRPGGKFRVGQFLTLLGRGDAAVPYLKAADVDGNYLGYRLTARHLLKARGGPLVEYLIKPTASNPEPGAGGKTALEVPPKP